MLTFLIFHPTQWFTRAVTSLPTSAHATPVSTFSTLICELETPNEAVSAFTFVDSAGLILSSAAELTLILLARHSTSYCRAEAILLCLLGAHFRLGSPARANVSFPTLTTFIWFTAGAYEFSSHLFSFVWGPIDYPTFLIFLIEVFTIAALELLTITFPSFESNLKAHFSN